MIHPPDSITPYLGLIGSGQLARMLCESARELPVKIQVLAGAKNESCTFVHSNFVVGSPNDVRNLHSFFQDKDFVLFENEFLNADFLAMAAEGTKIQFCPRLEVLRVAQDKLFQKSAFERVGIKSAKFEVFDTKISRSQTFETWARSMIEHWPSGAVFKWSRMGYDGKGTLISDYQTESQRLQTFEAGSKKNGAVIYAEEKLKFQRELAMVGARNSGGQFYSYPLVISEQVDGICKWVYGPATSLGVASSLETQARDSLKKIGENLDIVGVFAVEFFEIPAESGASFLLVNELAPRVHNTGHCTQNAASISQFEMHLRTVLGLPVESLKHLPYFGMLNLLGPRSADGLDSALAKTLLSGQSAKMGLTEDRFRIHWYDKGGRPGRKLGHVNFWCQSKNQFDESVQILREFESWWDNLILK